MYKLSNEEIIENRRTTRTIRNNKWIKSMYHSYYNSNRFIDKIKYKILNLIERYYQIRYNNSNDDVFIAWLEGEPIGIDWKNVRGGTKGSMLIQGDWKGKL